MGWIGLIHWIKNISIIDPGKVILVTDLPPREHWDLKVLLKHFLGQSMPMLLVSSIGYDSSSLEFLVKATPY